MTLSVEMIDDAPEGITATAELANSMLQPASHTVLNWNRKMQVILSLVFALVYFGNLQHMIDNCIGSAVILGPTRSRTTTIL